MRLLEPSASPGLRKRLLLNVFARYRRTQAQLHKLNYLFWECTLRCNLNCLHCGSDCTKQSDVEDMPVEHFLKVLDEISTQYKPKDVVIAVTGGEPLVRKDLAQCGAEFQKRGFPWGIVTNGHALTQTRFDELVANGLRCLTISLDGLEQSHNWLRCNQDSFSRAVEAIRVAAKHQGLAFDIVTCVNQKNFPELPEIKRLLVDMGVKRWRLAVIFPKGRARDNPLLTVNGAQFCRLLEFIKATRKEGLIRANHGCEGFLGSYEGEVRDGFFWCRAGVHAGSVLVDGSISACPSLRADYIQGNIYKDSFLQCWNNRFQVMRNRSWTKTGDCADCTAYKWCEGNGLHLRDETTGKLLRCHLKLLGEF